MKDVRIKKEKVIEILQKNRAEHRDIFLKAQEKYREQAIKLLDEQLKAAREKKPFELRRFVELVQPEDHTHDYDRALEMLSLEENDVVVLSTADFSNLVQDQWEWSRRWAVSNSRYTDSPKFRSLLNEPEY